jgi:hypothetical protein
MRTSSGIGNLALLAHLALVVSGTAGCTVGDPDDIDFGDGSADAARPDGGGKDAGPQPGPDDDGGSEPTPDAGGGTGVKLADLPRLLASATCDALEECIGSDELLADTLLGRDCYELNENLLLASPLRYLSASVAAGLVQFRPAEAEDCLADLRALSCDVRSSRWPASCELMLLGTVALGGECTINQDCSGDAFCDLGELESCPGTCAALQSEGMPCNQNDDDQCEDGLVCFRGECAALGAVADDCGETLPRCEPGLVCAGGECTNIPVLYFRKLDEVCERGVELCEPGLVCESTMGMMGVCKNTVAKDAACKRADPNQCPIDQYCDAASPGVAGTCRSYPVDGAACLMRDQQCADGHVCVANTCHELVQVGESCDQDAQCYTGACGDDGQCAGPLMCDAP